MNRRTSSVGDTDIETNMRLVNYDDTVRKLDQYYGIVKRQLLHNQSITLGLFPDTSQEKEIADFRTSIYCSAAIWSLYQAYRRIDDDHGKAYELGQSAVKCMRGILKCWMQQPQNVEQFKRGQQPNFALHSKFHLLTGSEVLSPNVYGHLQIDVVSLYLLFLVQMITSGLQMIYTMDEVTFVQNLVYYVERAYRTPDFGMWERGTKYNNGTPELHASSIGIAKAALEAINGCNLFGEKGASWSVIFVDIDAHNRNRSIFETLLPRESSSKNVDASLLAAISFPAFATHDNQLYTTTKQQIVQCLKGKFGFKRFCRDGYGTSIEDRSRQYYHTGETKEFEKVECEWPLFYLFMIVEAIFKGNNEQVEEYKQLLRPILKTDSNGDTIVPKFYFVRSENIRREKAHPGTQPRQASSDGSSKNLFLWGQSMWIIASLLMDNLVHINEIDLIRRYLPSYNRPRKGGRYSVFQSKNNAGTASDLVVQVVLIAESMRLQAMMATYGIQTQTPLEVEPVQIWPPRELVKVYQNLGVSEKLGLKGRPPRPIGALGTSKVTDFYLSHDMALLIDNIKTELHFIGKYWRLSGRPTVCILIREEHMRDVHFHELLNLLAMLKTGYCDGLKVRTGRLQNLLSSSCIEHLDFMCTLDIDLDVKTFEQVHHASAGYQSLTDVPRAIQYSEADVNFKDTMFNKSTNEVVSVLKSVSTLHGQTQLLGILSEREGDAFSIDGVTVKERVKNLLSQACSLRYWSVVRECTALLCKEVESISPFITTILVSGKQLSIGCGDKEIILDRPVQPGEIHALFYSTRSKDVSVAQAVLQQEVVLCCGKLIGTHCDLFEGILNIRIVWMIRAMCYYMQEVKGTDLLVESLAPNEVRRLVVKILSLNDWALSESSIEDCEEGLTPRQIRVIDGCLGRTPRHFYEKVWHILEKTPCGIALCDHMLAQQPTISEMSPTELDFALSVQAMLGRVKQPEYRQIVVELFTVISTILERNPELRFMHEVKMDQIIRDAFAMFTKDDGNESGDEMSLFYNTSQVILKSYLARSVVNCLLSGDIHSNLDENSQFCNVS